MICRLTHLLASALLLLAGTLAFAGPEAPVFLILTAPYGAGHDSAAAKSAEAVQAQAPGADSLLITVKLVTAADLAKSGEVTKQGPRKITLNILEKDRPAAEAIPGKINAIIGAEHPGSTVVVMNCQAFMRGGLATVTAKAFNWAQTNAPDVYTAAFNFYTGLAPRLKSIGNMPMTRSFIFPSMLNFIKTIKTDAILSVWPHATEAMQNMRDHGELRKTPFASVLTDNLASEDGKLTYAELLMLSSDHGFVPSESVLELMKKAGVPPDRITLTGMPITLKPRTNLTFDEREERKRAYRTQLGFDPARPTVMIEAGSNGIGNYPLMIGSLVHSAAKEPITLVAACGRNAEQLADVNALVAGAHGDKDKTARLQKLLKPLLAEGVPPAELGSWIQNGLPKDRVAVRAVGFTPLENYRLAADVVVTKPGGLSTAEMAAEGVPMILSTKLASGQELPNVKTFVAAGLAVENKVEAEVDRAFLGIFRNRPFLERLYDASERVRQASRTDLIGSWLWEAVRAPRPLDCRSVVARAAARQTLPIQTAAH